MEMVDHLFSICRGLLKLVMPGHCGGLTGEWRHSNISTTSNHYPTLNRTPDASPPQKLVRTRPFLEKTPSGEDVDGSR